MSSVWIIRAGRDGKDQGYALEHGCAVLGWSRLGNISELETVKEVRSRVRSEYPEYGTNQKISANASSPWRFAQVVQKGDWVVLPLRGELEGYSAIGRITGDYSYVSDAPSGCKHQRSVKWDNKEFPVEKFRVGGASSRGLPLKWEAMTSVKKLPLR